MSYKKVVKFWRHLVVGLLILAGLFALINGQFFWQQLSFWWQRDVLNYDFTAISQPPLETPDEIRISALGIHAPLVYIDDTDANTIQAGLAQGVVHYPGTALPGERGNAFYFGHSSDFPSKPGQYKTVFALLPQINLDDEILITDRQGRQFAYRVISQQVVSATDIEWLKQGDRSQALLTLQTSYPVGTALRRYIVQAELVQ